MKSGALTLLTESSEQTLEVGACLGRLLEPGDVVALVGELGTGKTVLVKGVAQGLGVSEGSNVRSPSFVILNIYQGRSPLYHLDLYRIREITELEDLGYRDFLYGDGVAVIEWAERMQGLLPEDRLEVRLEFRGGDRRELTLEAKGDCFGSRWAGLTAGLARFR